MHLLPQVPCFDLRMDLSALQSREPTTQKLNVLIISLSAYLNMHRHFLAVTAACFSSTLLGLPPRIFFEITAHVALSSPVGATPCRKRRVSHRAANYSSLRWLKKAAVSGDLVLLSSEDGNFLSSWLRPEVCFWKKGGFQPPPPSRIQRHPTIPLWIQPRAGTKIKMAERLLKAAKVL